MANGHGGKRAGAGRKKGVPNKGSADLTARIEAILGGSPVEKLAEIGLAAKYRADQFRAAQEHKLAQHEDQIATKCLGEVAQYCAPKRKAIEHSGNIDTKATVIKVKPAPRPKE